MTMLCRFLKDVNSFLTRNSNGRSRASTIAPDILCPSERCTVQCVVYKPPLAQLGSSDALMKPFQTSCSNTSQRVQTHIDRRLLN